MKILKVSFYSTKKNQRFRGDWHDSDGNKVTFTNWDQGQPNSYSGNQDYVAISYSFNKWGDFGGNTRGQVICFQQVLSEFYFE